MRARSGLLARGAFAAALFALSLPAPAAWAGAPLDYTKVEGLSQPQHETVEETFRVPMSDGKTMYVEVTRPKGEGRFPVILEASPYHGTLADREGIRIFPDPRDGEDKPIGMTGYFAPRGYAVVMMDLRGTGRSQGCLDHLGLKDASDIDRIVEWAAAQPWSSGRVGMTGHSYVGSTPSLAAAERPDGLVTIVPSAGLASMYDHQFQMGVPYWLQWAGPMYAYEALALERHLPPSTGGPLGATGDNFGNDMQDFGCGMPNSATFAGTGQMTGQYEGWHRQRDWRRGAARADIPIFMVHGVNDNAARIPAAEWFFKDRRPSKRDKVWIGKWDHGAAGATTCDVAHPNCRKEQWQYALHAWFDRHLKRRKVSTGPQVETFLNGDRVYTARKWSANGDAPLTFAAGEDKSFTAMPRWEEGSTYADYEGEPVSATTVVTGVPKMRLSASMTGPVQLVARLLEKDGATGQIDLDNPVTLCAIQPLLRNGIETVTPIVPGQRMDMEPQCFTAAHVLDPGDQLVLRISAPLAPWLLRIGAVYLPAAPSGVAHHAPTFGVDPRVTVFGGEGGTALTLPTVEPKLYEDVR